ncbi:hypothetical protein ACQP2X_26720 [Actinoplanes sp. CA-131856]
MSWHLRSDTIDAYLARQLTDAYAASAEAHLLDCAACRAALAARGQRDGSLRRRHGDSMALILDRIDRPHPRVLERILTGLGISAGLAKLTAGAPRLRHSWLAAGLAVLTVAVVMAHLRSGALGVVMFVVSAPVAPVLGIAFTYGRWSDPGGKVAAVAPFPALLLLLLRTVVVLASWLPVAALLSVALPAHGRVVLLWFVPALALTSLTVALSSLVGTAYAAIAVTTTWLVLAATTVRGTRGAAADVWLQHSPLFRPTGQVILAVLAVAGLAFTVARRRAFDERESS